MDSFQPSVLDLTHQLWDVLVVGSGPAGCTAALYAARAGRSVLMIHGLQPGGQLTTTSEVENFTSYIHIDGYELTQRMQDHAVHAGAHTCFDVVRSVDFSGAIKILQGSEAVYQGRTVIIASGASAKWLGVEGEDLYKNAGISACATCDGFFYRQKSVAVVGGGNTAVEEALYLAKIVSSVTLIHRRDSLRAEKILQKRLFELPNVHFLWNTRISFISKKMVHAKDIGESSGAAKDNIKEWLCLELESTQTPVEFPKSPKALYVDGLFVAIGHNPNTSFVKDVLPQDDQGYIIPKNSGSVSTHIPGIFVAGDVQDAHYRQAITSAGQGCMAALDADRFLTEQGI